MSEITDFNDASHRIESASATFQKGLYQLFVLKYRPECDAFGYVVRMYQCMFQLCVTQLLLDFSFPLGPKQIPPQLRKSCKDPSKPTRREIDPSAIVNHAVFERKRWKGFAAGHPLHLISGRTLQLYERVVQARHNLLYRPFLLDGCFWEDCTLIGLLRHAPTTDEAEQTYRDFIAAMANWHRDFVRTMPRSLMLRDLKGMSRPAKRDAGYFLELLFSIYRDISSNRPTETLLLTYARMLNPGDERFLQDIGEYRNQLVDVKNLVKIPDIIFPQEWHVGEI